MTVVSRMNSLLFRKRDDHGSAAVDAATGAGFPDLDSAQFRQYRFQLVPDPNCQIFAGRILQPGNIVQIIMIELFPDRVKRRLDVAEVHDPA